MFKKSPIFGFVLTALLAASTGCQTMGTQNSVAKSASKGMDNVKESFAGLKERFNLAKNIPWATGRQKRENPPERLVAFWKEGVLQTPGKKPIRGFGGRIYFYERKEGKPVKVEGQLVVYAFDETARKKTDNRPTRRYVFPAEQLAKHQSESEIGPSYSIWLPWDATDGEQKEISLIARFEPKNAPIIVGHQTKQTLPGTLSEPKDVQLAVRNNASRQGINQAYTVGNRRNGRATTVSYESPEGQRIGEGEVRRKPSKRMTSTTIAITQSLARKTPQGKTPRANARSSQKIGHYRATPNSYQAEIVVPAKGISKRSIKNRTKKVSTPAAGFQLSKRLAPEARVSPPATYRGPISQNPAGSRFGS